MLWWIPKRYWSHFLVGWMVLTGVLTRSGSGPHLGLDALPMAVIASWAWALHSASALRAQVAEGFQAQHHTWNSLLRSRPSHDPSPLYSTFVQRMRSTEKHLHAVARKHRLRLLTIAFVDGWDHDGHGNEAASLREGRRAHVWLGSNWFGPQDTVHLPVVLEHELGHILRRDNQRSTVLQATGILLTVLAAAWLPLPLAVSAAVALRLQYIGWSWWTELACDARAVRICGRDAVIALWERHAALLGDPPQPARLWNGLRSASTHPPYALRVWWAHRINAPVTPASHPLAVPPDAYEKIPPLAA
ncbi:M48 family metalloprotease [Streptomyces sp. NPDC005538]|uniref:M48 family metalloprotease n=1 Tax=Streptomyces sp. NPDC005538 TaxID=3157043 RepID=UPI0033A4DD04